MDDMYNLDGCGIGYFVQLEIFYSTFASTFSLRQHGTLRYLCIFFAQPSEKDTGQRRRSMNEGLSEYRSLRALRPAIV